mgnify:CR=1 FL=1
MALTVSILPDHKGFSRPSASADEYCVDALITITTYETADVVNASQLGLSRITTVCLTGSSQPVLFTAKVVCDANGKYASDTSFKLMLLDASTPDDTEVNNATNITDTTLRVKVWGHL